MYSTSLLSYDHFWGSLSEVAGRTLGWLRITQRSRAAAVLARGDLSLLATAAAAAAALATCWKVLVIIAQMHCPRRSQQ